MAGKLVLPRVLVMVLCDEIADHPGEEYVYDLTGVRSKSTRLNLCIATSVSVCSFI